mmetsp:Transcript_14036/g.15367  ORF Transcript_14036/g.15367 Transcript_14036/m.15367 type:complete len:160 (-) Transcript_14036:135-614(-)
MSSFSSPNGTSTSFTSWQAGIYSKERHSCSCSLNRCWCTGTPAPSPVAEGTIAATFLPSSNELETPGYFILGMVLAAEPICVADSVVVLLLLSFGGTPYFLGISSFVRIIIRRTTHHCCHPCLRKKKHASSSLLLRFFNDNENDNDNDNDNENKKVTLS